MFALYPYSEEVGKIKKEIIIYTTGFVRVICNEINKAFYVTGNIKDGLLCLLSFYCELWINIWGNSSHSAKNFKIQKNTIRITTGCRSRNSCRDLFNKLKILPIQSQYILSLLLFVVDNKNKF
jgi:hypothetical protein